MSNFLTPEQHAQSWETPLPVVPKMSRAEVRRLEKESKKTATYNFTEEQLQAYVLKEVNDIRDTVFKDTADFITDLFMVYTMTTLHDKFGFGTKRLNDFKSEVDKLADFIEKEELASSLDLVVQCHDKFGVDMSNLLEKFKTKDLDRYYKDLENRAHK